MLSTTQSRTIQQSSTFCQQQPSGRFNMTSGSGQPSLFGSVPTGVQAGQLGSGFNPVQPLGFGSASPLLRLQPQGFGSVNFGVTQPTNTSFNQCQPITGFGSIGQQGLSLTPQPASSLAFNMNSVPLQQSQLSFASPFSSSFPLNSQLSTAPLNLPSTSSWSVPVTSQSGLPSLKGNKDDLIPQGLAVLVQGFKSFVAAQKNFSSEVTRGDLKPIVKVSEDTDAIVKHFVVKLKRIVNRNNRCNIKLKEDTIRSLSECELAQGMVDISSISSDTSSPYDTFFSRLAERYKEQIVSSKMQLENTEKHLSCVLNPTALTPQELYTAMLRLHDSFVALAGRLQYVHSSINGLKQGQLDVRKKRLNDFTNIFDKRGVRKEKLSSTLLPSPGPTPFSGHRNYHVINMMASQARMLQSLSKSEFPLSSPESRGFNAFQSPMSVLNRGTNPNFQLKPPPGNKRGKR